MARFVAMSDGLWPLSVALQQHDLLDRDDRRLLAYFRKASARPSLRSDQKLEQELEDGSRFADRLLARLPPDARDELLTRRSGPGAVLAVPRAHGTPAPRRRATLPLPLSALPSVDLLHGLETGRLTWQSVLTPTVRVREVTLGQMREDDVLMKDVERRRAVLEQKGRMSARAAMRVLLDREPDKTEVRWAQRVWERAADGRAADVDRRRMRMTRPTVMVPLVQALALKFYNGRRAASAAQIAALVNEALKGMEQKARNAGFVDPFPSVTPPSIARFISRLPPSIRRVRNNGYADWAKQERLVDKQCEALRANHIWEIDHTLLDIMAVRSAKEPDETVNVYVTACVDAFSGMPMNVFVSSLPPDAYTTSIVLSRAIRRRVIAGVSVGGLPIILRPDHGKDFMSLHVARVAEALPIQLDAAAQHNPDGKPHVERFMRTLNQAMAKHPGHKGTEGRSTGAARKRRDQLLTVRGVIDVVRSFAEAYAQRQRDDIGGSPLGVFTQTVEWRDPTNPDDLDLLLLKEDEERTLTRDGVRFRNTFYKGAAMTDEGHALQDLTGRKVVVRYHPDIEESVIIYDSETGTRIGEFVREELWKADGGSRVANQGYIPGLKQRTTEYRKLLETEDRAAAKVAREAELAAVIAEKQVAAEAAGVREPSRAERTRSTRVANEKVRRRDQLKDLLD